MLELITSVGARRSNHVDGRIAASFGSAGALDVKNRGADFVGLFYLPVVSGVTASLLYLPGLSGTFVVTER